MDILKFTIKLTMFLFVTLILSPFYFIMLLIFFRWRQHLGPLLLQWYSRICLMIFRVSIDQVSQYEIFRKHRKAFLIIANHASFLDIFILSALFRAVFVSKAEVRSYPIIGQIAWLMGILFLDRSSAREKMRLLKTLAKSSSGKIFVVFPQGTTSRITDRKPFKRGIFKIVELNPDISLLPVTIHYKDDARIAWHKPQSIRENAIRVCAQNRISVKVTLHKPVTFKDYKKRTSSQIAKMVEQTVLEHLQGEYENLQPRLSAIKR